ncbi:hypothetical protein QN277_019587 [Acacia crassicarpa]|uniref:Non-LTR retroelement reverse transcriptase n=1 Tax=Acacia crassicarpa TaxID=499986 RepID=A0AAE1MR59_9FABA|nr:hypothetical protein QN277_019587 [Acacia crassicarpa]
MILALKDEYGVWVQWEEELQHLVVRHFKSLFCTEDQSSTVLSTTTSFPPIDPTTLEDLGMVPSDEEIRRAVFSMGCYKAPGIDGYPPIFYKHNWCTVGPTLCSFVKGVFSGEVSVADSNRTLISLIPKRDRPEQVSHFRPISLCTVHYKCVTKIITLHLREIMNDLISPFQSSFIRGRHIQDNIIIGQEVMHIMNKNRSRKGLMAWKIDLEKAYDRVRWDFLHQVLTEVGFKADFIHLIISCVSSVSYNVIWNGTQTEFFFPRRGLRQGDPISPLLFVLCMEKLSHLICDEVSRGGWKPISVSNSGLQVSHLLFADDLLLFGVASENQALCMLNCLDCFSRASGGKVSCEKSSVFFSPRVPGQTRRRILGLSNMKASNEIGRYLGFPLTRCRKPTDKFHYVIEWVRSKLSCWKASCLSIAGRITLAKSVLSSIPVYPMIVAKIPVSVCHEVERIQRNFIWGHTESTHQYHPIGWDQLTLPKQYGGLGFRRLEAFNRACGVKLAWQICMGSKGLWAEILQQRYLLREGDSLLAYRKGDSQIWKFICAQKDIVELGTKWQIRNGQVVNFFNDCWLVGGQSLKGLCTRQLTDVENSSSVADWVCNGEWNFDALADCVQPEVLNRLLAQIPLRADAGYDVMVWGAESDGKFSIRSAYFLIERNPQQRFHHLFKIIWSWPGVERIRVFMWRVFLDRLPTNTWRHSWAHCSDLCDFCGVEAESILHVLRDCQYAKQMWMQLIKPTYVAAFFSAGLRDWMAMNLKGRMRNDMGSSWNLVFGVAIWKLWGWRNSYLFERNFSKPPNPADNIMHSWSNFAMTAAVHAEAHMSAVSADAGRPLVWQKPPADWIKINTDGAVALGSGRAGCGGVLRDSREAWVCGFMKNIGVCSVTDAEEWAIFEGMRLAWELGFRKAIVESDSLELIARITDGNFGTASLLGVQIRDFISKDWQIIFEHIPRELNRVADALAKQGISSSVILENCPVHLRSWVNQESLGFISPVV